MINVQAEIDKLIQFNKSQQKVVSQFCSFIQYDESNCKIKFNVDIQSMMNAIKSKQTKEENKFTFSCKRKHLLRFIHPDKLATLNIDEQQTNHIHTCVVQIISNSLNIVEALKLLRTNVNESTFAIICNKLKLTQADIHKLATIDNTVPPKCVLLETYTQLQYNTCPLKGRIVSIIYTMASHFTHKIIDLLYDLQKTYYTYKYGYLVKKEDECANMQCEDYYIECQLYQQQQNDQCATIKMGHVATILTKYKYKWLTDLLHTHKQNTPYLYEYLCNLSFANIYSSPSMETIAELEFTRFSTMNQTNQN